MVFDATQPSYLALRGVFSERTTPVVFWVGAGLSAPAGLPTWRDLKQFLVDTAVAEAAAHDDEERRRKEAESIASEPNNWLAFERLKKLLGHTTFRESVRTALAGSHKAVVPDAYKEIWKLRPSGLLTLNVDRMAARAYIESGCDNGELVEVPGHSIASRIHVLKRPAPFAANLHGTLDDVESWVFTKKQLKTLIKTPGYGEFITSCLTTRLVIFVGITAEDEAVGGFLSSLNSKGIDSGAHYWVTDRRDRGIADWAERVGVRRILYDSSKGHEVPLKQFFADLRSYVSPEDSREQTPILLSLPAEGDLPSERQLLQSGDTEHMRRVLNSHAARLINDGSAYDHFCEQYDEAIHQAWYTTTLEGRNLLFGYQLLEEVARGAFGRVYRALDPDGSIVAIKVLLEDVRRDRSLLNSFRRGVRSMTILQNHRVEGMVPYRRCSEIPAFVVMDWIEGPNLEQAVLSRHFEDWADLLRMALELAAIVRRGHTLPERVLHRDLRPANVMIRGFYTEPQWKVVVLDFDLSWHRDAVQKSVLPGNAMTGYLAPEQMAPKPGVSTRHSAVDSFGFGMTLFYVLSGRHPYPGEYLSASWQATLFEICTRRKPCRWQSTGHRIARLVNHCTREAQAARWDFSQIEAELRRVAVAVGGQAVPWTDLCAEEVFSRAEEVAVYSWHEDLNTATHSTGSGVEVSLRGDDSHERLVLLVTWASRGNEERKSIGKWIPAKVEHAQAALRKRGWKVTDSNVETRSFDFKASISTPKCEEGIASVSDMISEIVRTFRFE